jgi:uncharacterized membrane protein HdeD (DUF308 family)
MIPAGSDTIIAGLVIPSTSPLFLTAVAVHVVAGLACIVAGILAMLSNKGPGRHPRYGRLYYGCLSVVFVSAVGLSAIRWAQDYPLFILAAIAFAAASLGRTAMHRRWRGAARLHIASMGLSYVVLLTAFYVDNGKNLPIWRGLPQIAFWLLPSAIGVPIVAYVMLRHPLVRPSALTPPPAPPLSGATRF